MPTDLYIRRLRVQGAAGRGQRASHAAGVHIKGTFSVSGVPKSPVVYAIVVACPGGTTYGYFCGTQTNPAYEAFTNYAKGSSSHGTYDFGTLPKQQSGWEIGLILLDGGTNGGYYPASTPVTVAVGGVTGTVTKSLSMAFVTPEDVSTFGVAGAPKGYQFYFEAVACPSVATPDQVVIYEDFGACAIVAGQDQQKVGFYLTPGSWTIRYYYEPFQKGVEMAAAPSTVLREFDLVGPTITVPTLASSLHTAMTGPYNRPSITGKDTSQLTQRVPEADLVMVDPATNTALTGVYINPAPGAKTNFDVFLDPGTYAPYSEIVPPFKANYNTAADFIQVLVQQIGPNLVISHGATKSVKYTVPPFSASIIGGFAIKGVDDPANNYGEDNAIPLSMVVICPSPEPWSLECANGIFVSPSELLGGSFFIYDLAGGSTLAFTYTTLDGNVVVGPTVTVPASSAERAVTLSAPYSNPKMWGTITLTGDNNFQLEQMWTQACPATETFSLDCANGISDDVASFGSLFFQGGNTQKFGYGMDLPKGAWKVAVAGTTDPTFSTVKQLGPAKSITVPNVFPVLNLNASV
jgi:hypothetical protein